MWCFCLFCVPNCREIGECSIGKNMEVCRRDRVYGAVPSICLKVLKQIPKTRNEYIQCPDQI